MVRRMGYFAISMGQEDMHLAARYFTQILAGIGLMSLQDPFTAVSLFKLGVIMRDDYVADVPVSNGMRPGVLYIEGKMTPMGAIMRLRSDDFNDEVVGYGLTGTWYVMGSGDEVDVREISVTALDLAMLAHLAAAVQAREFDNEIKDVTPQAPAWRGDVTARPMIIDHEPLSPSSSQAPERRKWYWSTPFLLVVLVLLGLIQFWAMFSYIVAVILFRYISNGWWRALFILGVIGVCLWQIFT